MANYSSLYQQMVFNPTDAKNMNNIFEYFYCSIVSHHGSVFMAGEEGGWILGGGGGLCSLYDTNPVLWNRPEFWHIQHVSSEILQRCQSSSSGSDWVNQCGRVLRLR